MKKYSCNSWGSPRNFMILGFSLYVEVSWLLLNNNYNWWVVQMWLIHRRVKRPKFMPRSPISNILERLLTMVLWNDLTSQTFQSEGRPVQRLSCLSSFLVPDNNARVYIIAEYTIKDFVASKFLHTKLLTIFILQVCWNKHVKTWWPWNMYEDLEIMVANCVYI